MLAIFDSKSCSTSLFRYWVESTTIGTPAPYCLHVVWLHPFGYTIGLSTLAFVAIICFDYMHDIITIAFLHWPHNAFSLQNGLLHLKPLFKIIFP